jgi:hypothetical protein
MPLLVDFDELLLKVRSPAARAHIVDAVAAFRAVALRPAVVSTWAAVVFDIMAKIREIELTGDARARLHVQRFDEIRTHNNVVESLAMERSILDVARDEFELITQQEHIDLTRLWEDRHRCAHPAMNTADDAYQPSAELVRYHIASALTHLLVHVPVQGRAALTRLMNEVRSPLFPPDIAGATRVLSGGPMQRPKDVLVRDFVLASVKATLRGELADDEAFASRALAAVAAVATMHPAVVQRVYSADVPRVLGGLNDEDVWRVLRLGVAVPAVWDHMPEAVRTKLERLIDVMNVAASPRLFLHGVRTPALRTVVDARSAGLQRDDLVAVFRDDAQAASASRALVARAVELVESSPSWNSTNELIASALMPSVGRLTDSDFERIAAEAQADVEVRQAHGTLGLLLAIRDAGTIPLDRFFDTFFRCNLASQFMPVLDDVPEAVLATARGDATTLRPGDRVRHPVFGEGQVVEVEGTGNDERVKIEFSDVFTGGRKTFLRVLTRLDAVH